MPFAIDKLPKGLISALGLRRDGRTPQELADQAVLTLDAAQLYLLDTRVYVPLVSAAATQGDVNMGVAVPAGELWYVWAFTLSYSPGVGEALTVAPALLIDGAPIVALVAPFDVTGASQEGRVSSPTPFWAGPGSSFRAYVKLLTGAVDINGALVVTKLRV